MYKFVFFFIFYYSSYFFFFHFFIFFFNFSFFIFQLSHARKFSVTNLSSFNWCVETKLHTSLNSRKVKLYLYLCYLYMFFLFQNYFVAAIFSITPPTIPSFEMEEESWKNFLKYVHYVSLTMSVFLKRYSSTYF